MKIKSFLYEDQHHSWRLNYTEFSPLTLLVGASGVGKTKILRAIQNVVHIAQGLFLFIDVKWTIEFESNAGDHYIWSGEFGKRSTSYDDIGNLRVESKIVFENLICNDSEIFTRDQSDIFFKGYPTVKLAQDKSVLALIKDEPIASVEKNFRLISLSNYNRHISYQIHAADIEKYPDLQSIRNTDVYLSIWAKLYLCTLVAQEVFNEIKQSFIEIFPFVEDIKTQIVIPAPERPQYIKLMWKEADVDHWVDEMDMSSGMYRTLFHICELHLCPDGSVFLIDEFENSLGINCIDELTSALMTYERDLQFIITSHHPYIINNIDYKNWKIVTRKGGVVTARDAIEYDLGNSKHKAFTQLINLDAYNEGIEL